MTGQLVGTLFGKDAILDRWLDRLEGREVIERVAEDFTAHFLEPERLGVHEHGIPTDMDRYPPN